MTTTPTDDPTTPRPAPEGWRHEVRPDQDPHEHAIGGQGPCFGCWCYGCGMATDGPRAEHAPGIERHPGDPSHRWCFE